MARRIIGAKIIFRFDQPHTEEVCPQPVHCGAGEVWILGGRQPLGKCGSSADIVLPAWLGRIEEAGLGADEAAGNLDVAAIEHFADSAGVIGFALQSGEESSEAPELLPRPRGKWVVMTLGALDPHPQEQAGRA